MRELTNEEKHIYQNAVERETTELEYINYCLNGVTKRINQLDEEFKWAKHQKLQELKQMKLKFEQMQEETTFTLNDSKEKLKKGTTGEDK